MEKNLGHATAYGYAKSKGYSGTEEEFAELMADYASVGQSAAESAEQAAASATSASGSADTASQAAQTATSKASEAVTAADTANIKASEASTSADTASAAATSAGTSAQTATTAATTATTKASEASESAATATTAKTDAETARDAAAQSASEAAESARTLTIDATLTQAGQAADAFETGNKITSLKDAFDGLNNDVNNISGSVPIRPAEIGWAYISNGQIAYASSANGARLKKGWFLSLKQGDVIYTDNFTLYDFRGGYSTDAGNTWTDISWKAQTSFSIPVTGIYIFTFRDKNNNITNLDQHLSHFTIVRDSGILKQIESCLVEENGEWEE